MPPAQLFVDLDLIVRRAVRVSVESYSIKRLEPLYEFDRRVTLADANRALFGVQVALELGNQDDISAEMRNIVEGYNRDDCFSVAGLRMWLEDVREKTLAGGTPVDRPLPVSGAAPENVTVWQSRVNALVGVFSMAFRLSARSAAMRAVRGTISFLAHILDWHRREKKAKHWEYFRLRDLSEEDLLESAQPLPV